MHLVFDSDPSPNPPKIGDPDYQEKQGEQFKLMEQAMLRAFSKGSQKFVIYMVPKKKRKRNDLHSDLFGEDEDNNEKENEGAEEYQWIREYSYSFKDVERTNFIFLFSEDKVDYIEIDKRLELQALSRSKVSKFRSFH
jgi:hypothetical protein